MAHQRGADRFELDRRLREETRRRLKFTNLVECKNLGEPLYVTDWFDDGTDIIGVGCTRQNGGATAKLTLNVKPGLFIVSADVPLLRVVAGALGFKEIEVYEGMTYEANNFNIHEILCEPRRAEKCQLLKLVTPTFGESIALYHRLKRDPKASRYASVTHYWDATKQVMFELVVRRHRESNDFQVPKITYRWFDSSLQIFLLPLPELPLITFDIETVSTDPHRVPTGEDVNDVLFTSSVHHVDARTLYTLVYLPIVDKTPDALKQEMTALDDYPKYDEIENLLEVFTCEVDLLRRTIELLTLNGRHHYLIGYNSSSYDIKYLLLRCHFYGLHDGARFVWKDGYSLGYDQIHLDLFRIAVMRYTYKKYTLGFVAKQLLKDDKVDVDAVALRFTFHRMRKRQQLYAHGDQEGVKRQIPSLRDALHYNNIDTLLVSKLIKCTRAIEYLLSYAHDCRVPLHSMNTNYNKMQYKVMNECQVLGLGQRKFFTTFKTSKVNIKMPLPDLTKPQFVAREQDQLCCGKRMTPHDYVMVSQNFDELISGFSCVPGKNVQRRSGGSGKCTYQGGANFCLGEYDVSNLQAYDYRIAYPLLIDRKNLSDETADVMPADMLTLLYDYIENKHQFTVYDYMTHGGSSKTETKIMFYQYIYYGTYCGGQFPFTKIELQRRRTSPVIIVWHGRRGVLADIITVFNDNREKTKNARKQLDGVLCRVDAVLQEYVELEEHNVDVTSVVNLSDAGNAPATVVEVGERFEDSEDGDADFGCEDDGDDFGQEISGRDIADWGCEENYSNEFGSNDLAESGNSAGNFGDFGYDDTMLDGGGELIDRREETAIDNVTSAQTDTAGKVKKFRFENDIIQVYDNGQCSIDEEMLQRCFRPTDMLTQLIKDISMERDELECSYRLQKSRVASIYGCVGSLKPRLAALITCMIRTTLLQSARYLVDEHKCTLYYCDTDSLFVTNPSGRDLSSTLNQLHPHTEIEMKTIDRCMFVQTKVYYYWSDGEIHYGHNANGPQTWHDMVAHFSELTDITTTEDLYRAFKGFYFSVRQKIISESAASGFESLLRLTQDVKLKTTYKTMTPANELKLYLARNYPALAGSLRQNIYYYQEPQNVLRTILRPSSELTRDAANLSSVEVRSTIERRLGQINLFKYFYNMFKTVFNIVKFHIKKNNEPYNVTLNDANARLIMLRAYLDYLKETNGGKGFDERSSMLMSTIHVEEDEGLSV